MILPNRFEGLFYIIVSKPQLMVERGSNIDISSMMTIIAGFFTDHKYHAIRPAPFFMTKALGGY